MKPFVHKNFVGDFFDVLRPTEKGAQSGGELRTRGGTKRQEAVVSVLAGGFTRENLPDFAASLEHLLANVVQLIVLDLSRVHSFSANAAGVLFNFLASVEGREKRLVLYRPSATVRDTLDACKLTRFFEIQETQEELLLSLPDMDI